MFVDIHASKAALYRLKCMKIGIILSNYKLILVRKIGFFTGFTIRKICLTKQKK